MSEEKTPSKRATKKAVATAEPAKPRKAATPKAKTVASATVAPPVAKTAAAAKPAVAAKPKKAATAPVADAPEAKPPVARKAATPRKRAAPVGALVDKPAAPSREERQRWIATAAYHRAEKRGFVPGYEAQDWFEAEAEIDALVGKA